MKNLPQKNMDQKIFKLSFENEEITKQITIPEQNPLIFNPEPKKNQFLLEEVEILDNLVWDLIKQRLKVYVL